MKGIAKSLEKCISILESAEERRDWGYVLDVRENLEDIMQDILGTTISVDESGDMMIPDLPIEIRQLKAIEKIAEKMVKMAAIAAKIEDSLDTLVWKMKHE
jgi:hypothetical protein